MGYWCWVMGANSLILSKGRLYREEGYRRKERPERAT